MATPLPELYPLTSLQIGDIQSYLSQTFLYFAPSSKRLLILVDNRPWSLNKHSKSTQLWQLMVTKYRVSPFINTRTLAQSSDQGSSSPLKSELGKPKKFSRWFSVIDATKWKKQSLLSMIDLGKALHGFIVFDLAWKDVHGINYYNELQTDTSLALEVQFMRKWEFNCVNHAMSCISSWFPGNESDTQSLKHNLRKLLELDIHLWISLSSSKAFLSRSMYLLDIFSDDTYYDAEGSLSDGDGDGNESSEQLYIMDKVRRIYGTDKESGSADVNFEEMSESNITPMQYTDNLLLLRFNDSILPFKLRQVLMSDLRLLRLLESGLPSWVIFLQSYPLFCHFYRPWVRPLVRTLYILISLSTFIIAFYDLYKNVPVLKETVAKVCDPFFSWIEKWDMVSRIQYLGTMLFLQNFEKGVRWLMTVGRTLRPVFVVIAKPFSELIEFFSPLWNSCFETGELVLSTIWLVIEYLCEMLFDLIVLLFSPFEFLYSSILDIVYPIMYSIWELFLVPIQCTLKLASYMTSFFTNIYELFKDVGHSVSTVIPVMYLSEAQQGAYEIPIWKELWNGLFKQVFRAVRSIINGLLAFFITCNRHRLSIYNHICEFLWRFSQLIGFTRRRCHCHQIPLDGRKEETLECDWCK